MALQNSWSNVNQQWHGRQQHDADLQQDNTTAS
jgi:hypothetical protein